MPRKGSVPKRDVLPDPIHNSKLVTKLINKIMLDGKRGTAQRILYSAFDLVEERSGRQAIEVFEEAIENIKDDVAYAVALDSTDIKALKSQNVQDVDAVVVCIGDNFEALMLTTVLLMELNVKRVISRANGKQQRLILEKVGVREILSPEKLTQPRPR